MTWDPARWRAEFNVTGEEALWKRLNKVENIEFTLDNTGLLHLRDMTTAIEMTDGGENAFSNGMLTHLSHIPPHPKYNVDNVFCKSSNRIYFGNGDLISDSVIIQLIDCYDEFLYAHKWKTGDLLLVDNKRYMHGRNMFDKAGKREIFTRFGWVRKAL
ncbi:hypothetical protein BOW52_10515 [Solemya elarraichensis gill symbiont]|uniref:TauD/TfdA-like domain-containing protein n=1 Tax=Solemya elarraichensis gill symbiont TaxID=1918949 RepID=A0A1T2KVN0_9GAMM|nr:hypothetical protein BOW52_10515 [Solemya elarraichensis gill symbiont]